MNTKTLIRNLVNIASKGGNYLLIVGPTAEGTFPPKSVIILEEVGNWMQANRCSLMNLQSVRLIPITR